MNKWVAVFALALILAMGCAPVQTSGASDSAGGEAVAASLPSVMVIGPGSGPALFLGAGSDAPAIGYLNPGTRVRLEGAPQGDRVEVRVGGALRARGWVPLDRLAAFAQSGGRIRGSRASVHPNDFVSLVSGPDAEGQMQVSVRPWLGGTTFLDAMVGSFPADQLNDRRHAEGEPDVRGECFLMPTNEAVPVYERPNQPPIATVPAMAEPAMVRVMRRRGPWAGVRIGYGPYISGYIRAELTPCGETEPTPSPMTAPSTPDGHPHWINEEPGRLYRVAARTRIRFQGRTIARLRSEGWGREVGRTGDGLIDIFVAVDNAIALRGLVREQDLTPVE